jgi:hypothetical protein
LSEHLVVRSPEPGGTLPPGGALRVGFRVDPGWQSLVARLLVDGEDVTAACGQRIATTFPASRVELVYAPAGGWAPGEHEAVVLLGDGVSPESWTFSVS